MPAVITPEKEALINTVPPGRQAFWDCWNLETHRGRQVWKFTPPSHLQTLLQTNEGWKTPEAQEFLEKMQESFVYDKKKQAHSADLVYRTQQLKNFTPLEGKPGNELHEQAEEAARKGFHFYEALQTADGNWPGDYGGPLFLLPGMIFISYITKTPLPEPHARLTRQYMLNMQNDDGGWGLHIEDSSTMLGTVLQYVALRLGGLKKDHPQLAKAQRWIHENGGANYIPTWGKFYLSVLGVYEWKGFNSILPELWKFPKGLPIHPSKYWCHTRVVHLPMAYCYAHRVKAEETDLIKELREELYTTPYTQVNWKRSRNLFCPKDIYTPHHWFLDTATSVMNMYEGVHLSSFRKKTARYILEQIELENKNTFNINLGPVNHIMNALCLYHAYGNHHEAFKKQTERWADYLWLAEDGMKMNGYNGSQFWDTNFAALALLEGNMENEFPEMARKIYGFLDDQQIKEDIQHREISDRSIRKGGYAFSTADQGWPITDCTAEGIKTSVLYLHSPVLKEDEKTIGEERMKDGINVLLDYQNRDGGWASYEKTRGPKWLEMLNAAEVFGDIMNDYSYAECTSACLQGLSKFRKEFPQHRTGEINTAIERGNRFLKSIQRNDGSWMGSWAVCFTYATWFGIEGLLASGTKNYSNGKYIPEIIKACEFLLAIQKEDGGWGEHFQSCVQKKYVEHPESQVTNTAWALLGLMAARHPNKQAIDKGIEFLLSKQDAWGDFPQQQISGVFNFNCMITYTSYRNVFPLWALSRYKKIYGGGLED